jgi:hypothetical protein
VTSNSTRFVLACAAACALAAGAAQAAPQTQTQQPSPVGVTAKAGDGSSVPGRPVRLRASAGGNRRVEVPARPALVGGMFGVR